MTEPAGGGGANGPTTGQAPEGGANGATPPGTATTPTPEEWLASLDETGKTHYTALTSALQNAHERQKEDNRKLREDLATATAAATGPLKEQLQTMSQRLDERERETSFLREALGADVLHADPLWKLAAQDERAFRRDGSPDWKHLRTEYPFCFKPVVTPRGTAGAGTGTPGPAGAPTMDDIMRKAAGRG